MTSRSMFGNGTLLALATALLAGGCGGDQESDRVTLGESAQAGPARDPLGLPPAVQAQVDSGNAAYRAREYRDALRHFRAAAALAPDEPTTWFGVGMAAGAVGDTELQRQAQARVQQLAPQAEMGDHSVPGVVDGPAGGGAMPPGHPSAGGELPPGHPEVEGELPPGHPPVGADSAG